jgi:hypothetical protein
MLKELSNLINLSTLIAGIVIGAVGVLLLQVLFGFLMTHWKSIVILSGVAASIGLLLIGLR